MCIYKVRVAGISVLFSAVIAGFFGLACYYMARTVQAAAPATAQQLSAVAFESASYVVNEGAGSVSVVLRVEPPSSTPVTVTVSSTNIQAEASKDFVALRQSLVISPNESVYTVTVTILDDLLIEGRENFRLTLGEYKGVVAGEIAETLVAIENDDIAYLGIQDAVVDEIAESVTLLITQSVISTLTSLVDVRTSDASATAPDDYSALITTLSIPPGHTEVTVVVPLNDDAEVEGSEIFYVALQDAADAELAKITATVTIIDDDVMPEILLEGAQAEEKNGPLVFGVSLSAASEETVTVEYVTMDGTATAPQDYIAVSGVLIFPPGQTTGAVEVAIVLDQAKEADETLSLVFSNPVNAILRISDAEGVIRGTVGEWLYMPSLQR
jgi:hypothetical protein